MDVCYSEPDYQAIANEQDFHSWTSRRNDCCSRIGTEQPPDDVLGGVYCNVTWDSWDCWDWTSATETAVQHCPSWIVGSDPRKFAYKECMGDGTWFENPHTNRTWTNYTNCACPEEKNSSALFMFYAGYIVSTITSAMALFIFCHFKSLGCPRVTIHKHLFISFILCGICNLLWHVIIIFNKDGACKIAQVIAIYFTVSNYLWVLSEGLYLHTVIVVAVFSENHNLLLYYIVGWVAPIVPTALFTIINVGNDFQECWTNNWTAWILGLSNLFVTVVNLGFLLNIVRVLVTKLRAAPSQGTMRRGYARAVRATLILLPLMGIPWIILPARPNCSVATVVYDFINYFLIAWQGFFVACIFCFFNGEVKMQIKRKWIPDNWKKRRGSDFRYRQTTVTVMSEAVSTTPRQSIHVGVDKEGESLITNLPNGKKHFEDNGIKENFKNVGNYKLNKSKNVEFTDINRNLSDPESKELFMKEEIDMNSDRTTPV